MITIWQLKSIMGPVKRKSEEEPAQFDFSPYFRINMTRPNLVWVFAASLADRMDNATWLDTTNELRALDWQVTLIGMGPAGVHQIRGIETFGLPRRNVYLLGHVLFHADVIRFLFKNWDQTDAVLFNQDSGIYLLPLRYLRAIKGGRGPRFVMDTRDVSDMKPGSLRTMVRIAYMKFNSMLANQIADGQTTITPRFAEFANIPQRQLWGIWPSGVNPDTFAAAAAKRQWPGRGDPVKLVYIGILLEKRHPIELCQAVRKANDRGCDFELYFYGNGPDEESVRQCAAASGGKIKVLPPIAHADVPDMLSRMHVGITSLPDVDDGKYAASSPVKLFEYMASGLPFLATTNPCHTDVVGDGSYAFWIDDATAAAVEGGLEQIWENRDSLAERAEEAREASRNWTWGSAAAKLDRALKSGLSLQPVNPTNGS